MHYSYRKECLDKYGSEFGNQLWELTNRIFDCLPLCAVIDGAVYAAHGGIPRASLSLKDVAALPSEISNPQEECDIAWEILWSDPMAQPQFVEMARYMRVDIDQCGGYLANKKRGTAWAFNEEALSRYSLSPQLHCPKLITHYFRFLAENQLTHVVRAHEVPPVGFWFHFGQKCATVR